MKGKRSSGASRGKRFDHISTHQPYSRPTKALYVPDPEPLTGTERAAVLVICDRARNVADARMLLEECGLLGRLVFEHVSTR